MFGLIGHCRMSRRGNKLLSCKIIQRKFGLWKLLRHIWSTLNFRILFKWSGRFIPIYLKGLIVLATTFLIMIGWFWMKLLLKCIYLWISSWQTVSWWYPALPALLQPILSVVLLPYYHWFNPVELNNIYISLRNMPNCYSIIRRHCLMRMTANLVGRNTPLIGGITSLTWGIGEWSWTQWLLVSQCCVI